MTATIDLGLARCLISDTELLNIAQSCKTKLKGWPEISNLILLNIVDELVARRRKDQLSTSEGGV